MFVVVGSGPAGIACAHALLEAGAHVTMLDAGLELEPERQASMERLRTKPRPEWDSASLAFMRDGVEVSASGVPLKLAYGSRFPYREPAPLPITHDGVDGFPSYARGGLSNVWGASMLPFRAEDMTGWPINVGDLEPHYRAVLDLMPYSARADGLEGGFPLYNEQPVPLRPSRQAAALLRDLEAARDVLRTHRVEFGSSRLGVRAAANGQAGCVYCGQCLYGCPYGFIFNSSHALERLRENDRFAYRRGMVVREVADQGSEAEVRGLHLEDGAPFALRADGVFLACGVYSTARIVLASLGEYGRTIKAVDNCYFLLPLLRRRGVPDVEREPLHTLAQVFLEVTDPAIGPGTTHLQVYTYNDLFQVQVRRMLGPLSGLVEAAVIGRLLLIQGYLHSDLSPGIRVTLREGGTLALAGASNPRTKPALRALRRSLWSLRRALVALPVGPAMRVAPPGRGYHTGGTFPMRTQPGPLETDTLGRPAGLERVHLVDASVFPSLPATTITLSVMANAHRIGTLAAA